MAVPFAQMWTVAAYLLRQRLRGARRYPLVLMLEPLYRCNLACAGCGKIQYPSQVLRAQLSVEECLRAVDECPAPVVSIPGGEPLLHPEIDRLVAGLVARRKYVYLCTNALLLEEKLDRFRPSRYLSFSVHLDGLAPEHDASVCRPGTYRKAVRAIEAALARGFRVTTNTTLFEGADPTRVRDFFDEMMRLGVEGMMVSPGYAYEAAADQAHFLARERTRELFRRIFAGGARRWRFNQSPLFLEFLMGTRDYDCTPWAMPAYGVFGWQRPCYLLQEGYARSYGELLEETRWERYGPRSGNPRCRDCMVHSGFEASAVAEAFSSWRGLAATARAALLGPRRPAAAPLAAPRAAAGSSSASAGAPGSAPCAAAAATRSEPGSKAPGAVSATASRSGIDPSRGETLDATPEALAAAFRYRGDVGLELDDGSRLEGFVANLAEAHLELWPRRGGEVRRVPLASILRVTLSGRDRAARGREVAGTRTLAAGPAAGGAQPV
jgi:hopanoid biosynthesis associated radical SAM protein HpnH